MNAEPLPVLPAGSPPSANVRVMLHVLRETEKAIQVSRDRWGESGSTWVPKSASHRLRPTLDGEAEPINVKVWLYARVRDNLLSDGEV